MLKQYYAKIKLNNRYHNRKIWYVNNGYICDCVNLGFKTKEECEEYTKEICNSMKWRSVFKSYDAKITYHYIR